MNESFEFVFLQTSSFFRLLWFVGFGYPRPFVDCSGLWFVALNGASLRNCSDIHPCRFLLLLCEEVNSVSLWSLVGCSFGHRLTSDCRFTVWLVGNWCYGFPQGWCNKCSRIQSLVALHRFICTLNNSYALVLPFLVDDVTSYDYVWQNCCKGLLKKIGCHWDCL